MPKLVWDQPGSRTYEGGIDKGVIYTSDGKATPWNGLVSVAENLNHTTTPIYFDGQKIANFSTPGTFSANINAVTYPDRMTELEGFGNLNSAIFISDQRPEVFNLSYRTFIGDDLNGAEVGYKIHILYNVTAIPSERTHQSFNSSGSLTSFSWEITAVPEEIPGFLPSAHIVIDSRKLDPILLSEIETLLYGGDIANPSLPPFQEFVNLVFGWFKVEIVDNNDGTWTARSLYDGYITILDDGKFRIDDINATYIDANTYIIDDTSF
jgi:hypothetical protein